MKRLLNISWTCEETLEIDIEDFSLSQDEIEDLVRKKVEYILPGNVYEYDKEWEDDMKPKCKESSIVPPDDFWIESVKGPIASTSGMVIFKGFQLPADFPMGYEHWKKVHDKTLKEIDKILESYQDDLPPHQGWFYSKYDCLLNLVEVVGTENFGYLKKDGELVGFIMATRKFAELGSPERPTGEVL